MYNPYSLTCMHCKQGLRFLGHWVSVSDIICHGTLCQSQGTKLAEENHRTIPDTGEARCQDEEMEEAENQAKKKAQN